MSSHQDSEKLTKLIMASIIGGLAVGLILHYAQLGHLAEYVKPIGDIFIRFLKMMITPLVLSSIFMAIFNLGTPEELGSMGIKAIGYYFATTAIAAFIGLVFVNIIQPGVGMDISSLQTQGMSDALNLKLQTSADTGLFKTILGVLVEAIPTNPFDALANTKVLQVIVFAILMGMVALFYRKESETFVSLMKNLESMSMNLVHWLMKVAPIGIFVLMLVVVADSGFDAVKALGKYMATVLIGLLCHAVVLLLIGAWRYKTSPLKLLKPMLTPMLTAFSTSSSAATLPITMAACEDDLGVDKKTAQFVLPLGATINMDGTALYESVAVIFIGQAYGLDLSIATQMVIFLTASLAAVGAAAIPGAGLVTMSIVLSAVGFPLEGIGLILAVDRILDMFRTSVNVMGDCIGTVVVQSFIKK